VPPTSTILAGFFDSATDPKCLVYSKPEAEAGRLQIWDVRTSKIEITLDQHRISELGVIEDDLSCANSRISPRRSLIATCFDSGGLLVIRSLETGQTLATYKLQSENRWLGDVSPDDRYYLYGLSKKGSQFPVLEGWNQHLDDWLKKNFPNHNQGILLDIETGKTWPNLIIGERNEYAFSDDSSRLISYAPEGRYEYDCPPKWEYFTPWAWASLGACIGLITACWKLRERKPTVSVAGHQAG
jgi:hypothetical protein